MIFADDITKNATQKNIRTIKAHIYFQRMHVLSSQTINILINPGTHDIHFNLYINKTVFDMNTNFEILDLTLAKIHIHNGNIVAINI